MPENNLPKQENKIEITPEELNKMVQEQVQSKVDSVIQSKEASFNKALKEKEDLIAQLKEKYMSEEDKSKEKHQILTSQYEAKEREFIDRINKFEEEKIEFEKMKTQLKTEQIEKRKLELMTSKGINTSLSKFVSADSIEELEAKIDEFASAMGISVKQEVDKVFNTNTVNVRNSNVNGSIDMTGLSYKERIALLKGN